MNIFAGVGKIQDMCLNGRVLKFNLSILQKRPCLIPCVIFDPDEKVKKFIQGLQSDEQVVWLKGILASNEFEYKGKQIRKLEILTYPNSIKTI